MADHNGPPFSASLEFLRAVQRLIHHSDESVRSNLQPDVHLLRAELHNAVNVLNRVVQQLVLDLGHEKESSVLVIGMVDTHKDPADL